MDSRNRPCPPSSHSSAADRPVSPTPVLLAPALQLSRRRALLCAVASGAWACKAGDVSTSAAASAPKLTASGGKPGGLDVVQRGSLRAEEKGGLLVVLLHGWRAHGDDLVPLAEELAHPRARFLIPAAPLAEPGGGRAWWRIDATDRPAEVHSDELPPNYQPHPQVTAARQAVQALLRDARQRWSPDAIALVGFSQGAMLALDLALAADPPVARVAVLSGTLLADSLPALHVKKPALPEVFVSHGRADTMLPFANGVSIESVLTRYGYPVSLVPFEGGHQIPPVVVTQLRQFLFRGLG
jgi:phospholipase/carboxylesterase